MEEAVYVARYANVHVTGSTFSDVGDQLVERGFDMTQARANGNGTLVVPHKNRKRVAAHLWRREPEHVEIPAPATPSTAVVAAAVVEEVCVELEPIPLTCGECGACHPEGVVCMLPIFFERRCCTVVTYAHKGPHEVTDQDGRVTHRWIEELVVSDLPFNGYGATTKKGDGFV